MNAGRGEGARMMAVFGSRSNPELVRTLDLAGYAWKAVASPDEAAEHEPADGWQAVIVDCTDEAETAWAFLRVVRKSGTPSKVLVLVGGGQLPDLDLRDELFDDFCLAPFHPTELEA